MDDYQNNSKIRYLNDRGNERVFSISYEEIEPGSRFEFPPFCEEGGLSILPPSIGENSLNTCLLYTSPSPRD